MALIYPLVQKSSIVAFIWPMLSLVSIALKIDSYKHYFLFSLLMMLIRFIAKLPYVDEAITNFSESVSEKQRSIPLLTIFGLSNLSRIFIIDEFLLCFTMFAAVQAIKYPNYDKSLDENLQDQDAIEEELTGIQSEQDDIRDQDTQEIDSPSIFSKINQTLLGRISIYSPYKIRFPIFIFLLDFIGFLILLCFYNGWNTYGTSIMTIVSGSSSISTLFVTMLFIMMWFMLIVHISFLSRNKLFYFIISVIYAISSLFVILFAIPYISTNQCWNHSSFYALIFFRVFSQLLMSLQLFCGFSHEPPKLSNKLPLFTFIYELIYRSCPFLFEIIICMKWVAKKTSISLFNTMILEFVKSKLKSRRASYKLFPPTKENNRCVGILFLIAFIGLLFLPLFLLSSSDRTTVLNPASIVQSEFGIAGIARFYESMLTIENSFITSTMQSQINKMNDTSLLTFYTMPEDQIQIIDLPFGSLSEFLITPDARDETISKLKDNSSVYIPYGTLSADFKTATTKNKVQNVVLSVFQEQLNEEQKADLINALKNNEGGITINNFIPMFFYVPNDSESGWIDGYYYNATFKIVEKKGIDYWQLETVPSNPDKVAPFFYVENVTRIVLYSQKSPDQYIGSLISSTGGIIGLYTFIIVTLGQIITSIVTGLFTDLWISRMHNPLKVLKSLLALEAYQLSGNLEKEFELSEILLENMRSTARIIQITDIPPSNRYHNSQEEEEDQEHTNQQNNNNDNELNEV